MVRNISLFFIIMASSFPLYAVEKVYMREYNYQAGDMDSRVTARENALKLMKAELLQEISSYVRSQSDITQREENASFSSNFSHTATVVSAGYVRSTVIDEKWDGRKYWLKAKLVVDPDEVKAALEREIENGRHDNASEQKRTQNPVAQPQVVPVPQNQQINPALQREYYLRAIFASSMTLVQPLRLRAMEYYSEIGQWPLKLSDIGLDKDSMSDGEAIESVALESEGVIRVKLMGIFGKDKEYILYPKSIMGGTSIKYICLTNVNMGASYVSQRMCKFVDKSTVEISDGDG